MNKNPQLDFEEAFQAFQTGNLNKAEKILRSLVNINPDYFYAIHLLAIVCANQFKHQEAISYYKLATELNPNDSSVLNNLGSSLNTVGQNEEAILVFKKALEIDPRAPDFFYNLGNTLCDLERYEEAIFYYEQSLKLDPQYFEAHNNYGKALYDLKRYSESLTYYDHALLINPLFIDCLINKGVSLNELKRFDEAIAHYDKALSLQPDYAEGWSNKGITLNQLQRYDEAITHYNKALSLIPDYAEGWSNKGVSLNELKLFDEAIAHYDKALSLKPSYSEAWSNKGVSLNELKRYDEAIAHYDKALSLKPDYHEAWSNKAVTLHELKRFDEAIAHYDKALSLKPDYAEGWSNKGVTLQELQRYDEAIAHYDKALSLQPDYVEGWSNKGITLNELQRYDEAIAHYDKALSLKPDYAEGWSNKGATLQELKRFDEAIAHYDKALSLKPDYAEGWSNKGATLQELKRFDEAIAHYDKALSLKPSIDWMIGSWLHAKMKICSWSDFSESLEDISKKVVENEKVVSPFPLLALTDDILIHKKSAEIYVQDKYPFNPILGPIPRHPRTQKIRLGYFSADFRNHPVAFLIAELFEIHDRSQFEIYAFSLVKAEDEMSERLQLAFDHFIETGGMTDIEIAQLSRSLNIDIAVDLTGITESSRTGIFSYRAAPIQVNYLGYPSTMGAGYMDYIIADKTLIPLDSQSSYTEKVIYLPNSYQANDRKRIILEKQFTRQELGLPENKFVFCCFNNNFKILPATFASWMRILKAVEGSVLWLFKENPWVVENLKKEAQMQGIDAQRLVFAERMPLSEHLARHRQADLFLDTLPYNAHTTTSDSLWTGLPVLTLAGRSFASRVAASLLHAIGLPELITNTQEEYEALAITLAQNPQKLAEIKLKLANNRLTAPLFDTPLFAKNLEAAYIQMIKRYQAELKPDCISIV